MGVVIHIQQFEGPLGLLLHLIRREEMDIFDINVHEITSQYMDYIKTMKQLNLEVAGEFIAMAATLIHIKSKMLLPQYDEEGEEIEEDPRKELVQRLLEYQKFQEVSHKLYERPLVGRDWWLRGRREAVEAEADDDVIVEENPLFALISSYRKVVKNMKKSVHRVGQELQSIGERILEIKERLVVGVRLRFSQLLTRQEPEQKAGQVLITFLSLLELAKLGFVSLFQSENYGEIHIEAKKAIENNAIERVESYEHEDKSDEQLDFEMSHQDSHEITEAEMHLDDAEDRQSEAEFEAAEDELVQAATDDEIFAEEQRLGIDREQPLPEEDGAV